MYCACSSAVGTDTYNVFATVGIFVVTRRHDGPNKRHIRLRLFD